MDVYIKNITKERIERCLQFAKSGWCIEEIPEIIELPFHGRLIDADALLERLKGTARYFDLKYDIVNAPTIIEAEQPKYADNK